MSTRTFGGYTRLTLLNVSSSPFDPSPTSWSLPFCNAHAPRHHAKALAIRASDPGNRSYQISDQDCSDQPGLILPARITLPHFSVSSAMCLRKSVGEPENGVPPRSASRDRNLGSARPAFISLLSLSTISAGVFLGAPMPNQPLAW